MIKDQKHRLLSKIKIDENGCWLWQGALDRTGYARVKQGSVNGKTRRTLVHRLSYLTFVGEIPEADGYHGTCVCHSCDVRHCINPEHLFLDTHTGNMRDMGNKGRKVVKDGEHHYKVVLTEDEVRDIRRLAREGVSQQYLADRYNVVIGNIWNIVNNKTWKH